MKWAYQPMAATLTRKGIEIGNRYSFRDLSEFTLTTQLMCDGEVLSVQQQALALAPLTSCVLPLPEGISGVCRYGCYVNLTLSDAEGYEVAACQVELPVPVENTQKALSPVALTETEKVIVAQGENFVYTFSKFHGSFVSMQLGDRELLAAPVRITTFRAPTDNERRVKNHWVHNERTLSENMDRCMCKIYSVRVEDDTIVTEGSLSGISVQPYLHFTQKITVGKDGTVDFTVDARVNERAFWLQRFGYEFTLNDPNAAYTYFGKGPGENYCDLSRHAAYGIWRTTAEESYVPYIRPQEHGNRYGVRYLDVDGAFRVTAQQPFECNVSQYPVTELFQKGHGAELVKDGKTHLRIDYKNSGIGSNSCGPVLLEQYRLSEKAFRFAFRLTL